MTSDKKRSCWHLPRRSDPPTRSDALPVVLCAIGVLCALPAALGAQGVSANQAPTSATTNTAPPKKRVAHNQREELYFERRYGIGELRVHSTSAGASLEFRCRVLDAEKAKALNNNRVAPAMIERKTGTKLSVMDNDGKPRQVSLEAGQEYSKVFGNRGRIVKPGDMVDLVIGTVHISGLIVQ